MFPEELLNLLVGNVDTELFEAVVLKVLETRHVQHSNSLILAPYEEQVSANSK